MSLTWILLEQLTSAVLGHVVDGIGGVLNSGATQGGVAQDVTNVVGTAGAASGIAGAVATAGAGAGAAGAAGTTAPAGMIPHGSGAGGAVGESTYPANPRGVQGPSLGDRIDAAATPEKVAAAERAAAERDGRPWPDVRPKSPELAAQQEAAYRAQQAAGRTQVAGSEPPFSDQDIRDAAAAADFAGGFTQSDLPGPLPSKLALPNTPLGALAGKYVLGPVASSATEAAMRAVNAADAAMLAPYRVAAAQYAASLANGGHTPNTVGGGFSGDEAGYSGPGGYTGTSSGPNASYGPRP